MKSREIFVKIAFFNWKTYFYDFSLPFFPMTTYITPADITFFMIFFFAEKITISAVVMFVVMIYMKIY